MRLSCKLDEQQLVIHCHRDKRRRAVDPVTGKKGTINRYVHRRVRDVPLFGNPCVIESAEEKSSGEREKSQSRMINGRDNFVDKHRGEGS